MDCGYDPGQTSILSQCDGKQNIYSSLPRMEEWVTEVKQYTQPHQLELPAL